MNKVIHKTTLSLLGVTFLSSLLLSSTHVFSDTEVIDEVRLTVPVACTMSGTGTTHTATLNPGTYSGASGNEYENGIGKTTLTAICNDDNGFSIYAIGFTGNEYGVTNLIGQNTAGTIATKAYESGDTTSNWSMKLTKITDSAESYNPQNLTIQSDTEGTFSSWHSIPSAYTKVAEYHANTGSSTTDTTLGVKLETTYATYIASNQAADTYVGQVKYTMVHPYTEAPLQPQTTASGKICYYPNGSNVDGTMGCQTIPTSETTDKVSPTSATLLASNFSRTGYGFAGWSNKFDYVTNPNQEGIKFYGPQETITYENGQYVGEGKGLSLYAVWIKSQGSIQDSTKVSEVCNRLNTAPTDGTANLSSVSAFTDSRDNNTYAVAKLADGKCWMIENLRLEAEDTRTPEKQALAQGYGTSTTYGNFSGLADAESTGFLSTYSANSLYSNDGSNGTINIDTSDYPAYRMPRYNNLNTPTNANDRPQNPTSSTFANNNTTVGMYSYGNYYTWHAAIADTTYNDSDNTSSDTTSLCPTGWRLPRGGQTTVNTMAEFYVLGKAIMNNIEPDKAASGGHGYYSYSVTNTAGKPAIAAFRSFPNNFLRSGVFASYAGGRGGFGYYWSSTTRNLRNSYLLYLDNSDVYPGTKNDYKYLGYSIRCTVSAGT